MYPRETGYRAQTRPAPVNYSISVPNNPSTGQPVTPRPASPAPYRPTSPTAFSPQPTQEQSMDEQQIQQYLSSLGLPTTDLPVQPGLNAWQLIMQLAIQKYMADLQEKTALRSEESRLAASPGSFVNYELFKRGLEQSGKTPFTGPSMSNQQISDAYTQAVGAAPGATRMGTGQFGVPIYNPGEIGRNTLLNMSEGERQLLGSFLQAGVSDRTGTAGVKPTDKYTQIDPTDYFKQVQQGFIPTMSEAGPMTRYA